MILQGSALSYTLYSARQVQDEYNYYELYPDFKSYVDEYGPKGTYHIHNFSFSIVNEIRAKNGKDPLEAAWFAFENPAAFIVSYREKIENQAQYGTKWVPSCAFDWFNLAIGDKLKGNPCDFNIEDGDAKACIGRWSGSAFKNYWCDLWNEREADEKFLKENPLFGGNQFLKQAIRFLKGTSFFERKPLFETSHFLKETTF
jgi:hypothetical protein